MKSAIVAVAILFSGTAMASEYSKVRATGLAHILEVASKCGYEVSPDKLTAYFKSEGFDNPEALAWINHKRAIESGWADDVTEQDCAMSRTTAESMGILR